MDVRSSFQSRKKALVLSLLGTAVRHTQWLPSEPPWGRAGGPWGSWWVGPREPEQVGRRAVRMLCEDVSGLFYVQSSTGSRWSCPAGPTLQNG